jgi:hypothetical protein
VISLDNIIRSYFLARGQSTLHFYARALKHAVDCLRKISLNHGILTKTVKCRVDHKKSIPWPSDALTIQAVAYQEGDRVVYIQPDTSVALQHSYAADGVSATANDLFTTIYNQNLSIELGVAYSDGSVNGVGYNGLGYCRVNHNAKEIQFSSEIDSSKDYYVFYRSSGFNPKSRSMVSEVFVNLVECYIAWKEAERKFGKSSGEAQACSIAYDKEQNEILAQLIPVNAQMIEGAKARASQFNRLAL